MRAPSYLKEHGVPQRPADLAADTIVTSTSPFAALEWAFGPDKVTSVQAPPRLNFNTYDAVIHPEGRRGSIADLTAHVRSRSLSVAEATA